MSTRPSQRASSTEPAAQDALEERDRREERDRHEERDRQEDEEEHRPSLEGILPELIRRGLEAGRGPLGRVSETFFPRDMAANVVAQLGDLRSSVAKAVAQEVGRFLRDADIATELRKVLIGLDVEATVRLRFKAREDGSLKPSVDVQLGDEKRPTPPSQS